MLTGVTDLSEAANLQLALAPLLLNTTKHQLNSFNINSYIQTQQFQIMYIHKHIIINPTGFVV